MRRIDTLKIKPKDMGCLTKPYEKHWWEVLEANNRFDKYYVIEVLVDHCYPKGNKTEILNHKITFKYDGHSDNHYQNACKYYDELLNGLLKNNKLYGIQFDIGPFEQFGDAKNCNVLVLLDFYACLEENDSLVYYLNSSDEWNSEWKIETDWSESDDHIIDWGEPPFGSLAWEIQSN